MKSKIEDKYKRHSFDEPSNRENACECLPWNVVSFVNVPRSQFQWHICSTPTITGCALSVSILGGQTHLLENPCSLYDCHCGYTQFISHIPQQSALSVFCVIYIRWIFSIPSHHSLARLSFAHHPLCLDQGKSDIVFLLRLPISSQ